jgi:nickel-dependent lactate racemase
MLEAVEMFLSDRKNLTFQIVQGPGKILTSMVIGDYEKAFMEAVQKASEQFCIPVSKKFDIVVTHARPPMDRTLYQAQKAIENGKIALKEGGIIILVAKCEDGIGKSTFWDLLTSKNTPEEVMVSIEKEYKLGYHKAAKIAQLSKKNKIFMVSEIESSILSMGFIRGFDSLEEAMKEAMSQYDHHPDILEIPDGTVTVPDPGE